MISLKETNSICQQGLSFGVGSSLSICNWGLREAGKGNNEYFVLAIIWLFLVGTLYFSNMAYKQVRDAYDAKQFARGLVDDCLRYSQYYNREHEVWKQFNETKSIDVKNGMKPFRQLLEFSDIFLSESEVAELVSYPVLNALSRLIRTFLFSCV